MPPGGHYLLRFGMTGRSKPTHPFGIEGAPLLPVPTVAVGAKRTSGRNGWAVRSLSLSQSPRPW